MAKYSDEALTRIYDKTGGKCRYCEKTLAFGNYGAYGSRGAWHVDHSRSRYNGGSDHGNNLFAACIDCNLDKGPLNGQSYQRALRANQESSAVNWLGLAGLALLLYLMWKASQDRQAQPPQTQALPPSPYDLPPWTQQQRWP